ncbi:MAG: hypothetical protein AAB628_01335 [Patescibacteria group bacterium]
MSDEKKDKIAELEKELYSKDFKPRQDDVVLRKHTENVPSSWDTKTEQALFLDNEARSVDRNISTMKTIKKILRVSVIFFAIAILVAGIVWIRGSNIISGENVKIEVLAPLTVSGGDPFESKFTITNDNKVSLENATLYLEYEEGFYETEGNAELPRVTKNLGTILPGQTVTDTVDALLYGEENTEKKILVTLEYQLSGSNATLKKTTEHTIKILTSPINVKLNMLKEATSGQKMEFDIVIETNNKEPLEKLLARVTYPSGFIFGSAEPAPLYNNNVWGIPKLTHEEKITIRVKGSVSGQEGEEKFTRIEVGGENPKDERVLGIIYNTTMETFTMMKPFIGVDLVLNGENTPEYVMAAGKSVRVDVLWKNNNPTAINDVVFEVTLKGEALNRSSIYTSGGGFYRSIDNTVVWGKEETPELAIVEPGAKGILTFNFSPVMLGVDVSRVIKNPQIVLEVRARAKRTSEANVPEEVSSFATRKVKIETDLRLSVRGLYYSGPFKNSGPLPPRAEKETTYTVVWTARNASNSISGASVRTTLPVYVKWLGIISPQGEDISYDAQNGEVVWNIGRMPAGGTREAAFQIALLPSLSQVGQYPDLTRESVIYGTDDFTKTSVGSKQSAIRTVLRSDPKFVQGEGAVVE